MRSILNFTLLLIALSSCSTQEKPKEVKRDDQQIVIVNLDDSLQIPLKNKYIHINDIPPRYQWEHNSGYCGEVSLISAGLYYGQYLSQYDAREIICKGDQKTCQMLLGSNDGLLAQSLRLRYDTIITQDSKELLRWVKNHVVMGHPVTIGVMNNEFILYRDSSKNAGDSEYDHIVPVIGIGSDMPFDKKEYYENDVILFSDNGLVTKNKKNPAIPTKHNAKYYYDYTFKDFLGSREMANKKDGHVYTLVNLPDKTMADSVYNYGIAILGIYSDEETLPVRICTDYNYEAPYIDSKSDIRPKPMPLHLTVKVFKLTPGIKYYLYQYNNENDVPYKEFNSSKTHKKRIEFTLSSGSEYILDLNINSDEKVFFRCVKAE